MELRNDPVVDELPRFGSGAPGVVLVPRTSSGVAFVWEPGGDADALVEFVGETLAVFEGKVFERFPDGSLRPAEWLQRRTVVVKPPAGDVLFLEPVKVTQAFAQVVPEQVPDGPGVVAAAPVSEVSAASVAGAGDGEQAESPAVVAASPAPAVKRGPGRPKKAVG